LVRWSLGDSFTENASYRRQKPPTARIMQNLAEPQKVARRPVNVLLVEDDDIDARIIDLVAGMVEGFSLGLTRVSSLIGAKAALQADKFDICLLDFWLGRECSLRFLAALDTMDTCMGTVVLSNISEQEATNLRLAGGRNTFLPKVDCTPQRLQDAIGAVISLPTAATERLAQPSAA
jgi:DNA-binding NtrC family response regulator